MAARLVLLVLLLPQRRRPLFAVLAPQVPFKDMLDLSGVWTGSPASGARQIVLATRSGGGYGTLMDNHHGREPGASYTMLCRTSDYTTSAKCGWQSAFCTVDAANHVACDVQPAGKLSGSVSTGEDFIGFEGGPWTKFTGGLSGIWASSNDADVDAYFMLHNSTTNAVVAWWDMGVTPQSGWKWKSGSFIPSNHSLFLFNLTSIISGDMSRVESSTGLVGWAKKKSQVIRPSDSKTKIHSVHMVFVSEFAPSSAHCSGRVATSA